MAALPPPPRRPALADAGAESSFDAADWERSLGQPLRPARWIGWRLRALMVAALLGSVGLFWLIHLLAAGPALDAQWRADTQGRLELVRSDDPALQGFEGRRLLGLHDGAGPPVALDAAVLQRSARWIVDDAERDRHAAQHRRLHAAADPGVLTLQFADGARAEVVLAPRGVAGLGVLFWVMAALALALYVVLMVVLLLRPTPRNGLYALMSMCQVGNLLFIGAESVPGLLLPEALLRWDHAARSAFDLLTAAAIVHATGLHPRAVPGRQAIAAAAWFSVGAIIALTVNQSLPHAWWWTQFGAIVLGCIAIGQLGVAYSIEPHPVAVVLRRFGIVAVGTLVLLTVATASAGQLPGAPRALAAAGSVVWVVFMASLLMLLPFLSRSQQLMREFAMLAGVSTVATSLDLLFVAVFALGPFTSLTLSLFLSLGLYAGVRQWILNQMIGTNLLTTERMFEQLYRIAREVEARPEKVGDRLARLLRELFEPLEVLQVARSTSRARVVADGSTLLVPVPQLADRADAAPGAIVLRFAHRGKRLFTAEDARLTDRVVEQLRRAVAHDRAVEQGRSEERVRIAQDLHDDIGARLLTLMYKAPNPEMEEYVRHTLQDLKTLTRGLAAPSHRLSHAAAEWKADITQRLSAADCELGWSFSTDRDVALSVVQWSALTRVLRELVSNAIAHAQATRVDIDAVFEDGRLTLTVSDNGVGRNPQAWAHGLGLGGVRKRVKQLGGSVAWRENQPRPGISCQVVIPDLAERG